MSKNYCSIDINSKDSYSGMCVKGNIITKNTYSEDISSLCAGIKQNEDKIENKVDNNVKFSAASNYKPRWEVVLEQQKK